MPPTIFPLRRRQTLIKTAAFCLGTAIVLWFITMTTPSDDRTPQPAQHVPHAQSQP